VKGRKRRKWKVYYEVHKALCYVITNKHHSHRVLNWGFGGGRGWLIKHVPPTFNRGYMERCIWRMRFCSIWCLPEIQPYSKFVHAYVCMSWNRFAIRRSDTVCNTRKGSQDSTCEIRVYSFPVPRLVPLLPPSASDTAIPYTGRM